MKSLTVEYAKCDRPIAAVVLSSGEERYSAYRSVVRQGGLDFGEAKKETQNARDTKMA